MRRRAEAGPGTGAQSSPMRDRLQGVSTRCIRGLGFPFPSPGCGDAPGMSATTRVFLVRHGATVLTAEDRFAGATDVPLSDEGRAQAERLAGPLASEAISSVYASPLSRTMETAEIVGKPHQLKPEPREGLREISHG